MSTAPCSAPAAPPPLGRGSNKLGGSSCGASASVSISATAAWSVADSFTERSSCGVTPDELLQNHAAQIGEGGRDVSSQGFQCIRRVIYRHAHARTAASGVSHWRRDRAGRPGSAHTSERDDAHCCVRPTTCRVLPDPVRSATDAVRLPGLSSCSAYASPSAFALAMTSTLHPEVRHALKNHCDSRDSDRTHGGRGRHSGLPGGSIRWSSEFGYHRSAPHARER